MIRTITVLLDIKVDTAVALISPAILNDLLDECDDFWHVFTDPSDAVGQAHVQPTAIIQKLSFVLARNLEEVNVLLLALADDLVVDVGDVHDHLDVVAEVIGEQAANNVEADVGARVTHVRFIVHGGTTLVPGDLTGLNGFEFVLLLHKRS